METVFQTLMPLTLVLVMTGLGLSLTPADFRRVVTQPLPAVAGVAAQLVVLPVVGFGLVALLRPEAAIAVGALCLVASPGGALSNLISHLGRGDTALSVSLTAVTSVASVVTAPLLLGLGLSLFADGGRAVHLEPGKVIGQIVFLVLLPVLIGMVVGRRWPAFARWADKPVRAVATFAVSLVVLAGILANLDTIVDSARRSAAIAVPLTILTLMGGWGLARALRLPRRQQLAIAVEGGIQNVPLAMTLGGTVLGVPDYTVLPAIYALVSLPLALFFVWAAGERRPPA